MHKREQLKLLQDVCNYWIDECPPELKLLARGRVRITWVMGTVEEYPDIATALSYIKSMIVAGYTKLMALIEVLEQEVDSEQEK